MKNLILAFITALLVGCGNQNLLKGKEYKTTGGANLEISLGFDQNALQFHGQAVNNYFGTYEVDGSKIRFLLSGSTMMAAPMAEMEAETTYFEFLQNVDSYELNGQKLILKAPERSMTFDFDKGE